MILTLLGWRTGRASSIRQSATLSANCSKVEAGGEHVQF